MKVEFKSADDIQLTVYDRELTGFSAAIRFILLNNTKCESWMDINTKILQSPINPNLHENYFCHHLISVQPDFHIKLDFLEFDVSVLASQKMILYLNEVDDLILLILPKLMKHNNYTIHRLSFIPLIHELPSKTK